MEKNTFVKKYTICFRTHEDEIEVRITILIKHKRQLVNTNNKLFFHIFFCGMIKICRENRFLSYIRLWWRSLFDLRDEKLNIISFWRAEGSSQSLSFSCFFLVSIYFVEWSSRKKEWKRALHEKITFLWHKIIYASSCLLFLSFI
jgi:hypothetical protein